MMLYLAETQHSKGNRPYLLLGFFFWFRGRVCLQLKQSPLVPTGYGGHALFSPFIFFVGQRLSNGKPRPDE